MSVKNIPAMAIVICDLCKAQSDIKSFKIGAHLHMRMNAIDYQGNPAADGSVTRDFCDACAMKVIDALNAVKP